jgi:hypothetical protein
MTQHNDNFNGPSMQFVLSFELLCLLRWLAEHDTQKLKRMIEKAFDAGLDRELQGAENVDHSLHAEEMHEGIVEFFNTCETLLAQAVNRNVERRARAGNLMPSVDKIDVRQCDNSVIRGSLEKATTAIRENPDVDARELFFKEILKRWKPMNRAMLN